MDEDQARTILGKVRAAWGMSTAQLLDTRPNRLRQALFMFPVDGVSFVDLERALRRAATDPRWAE